MFPEIYDIRTIAETCSSKDIYKGITSLSDFNKLDPMTNVLPLTKFKSGFKRYTRVENQTLHEGGYDALLTARMFEYLKQEVGEDKIRELKNKVD